MLNGRSVIPVIVAVQHVSHRHAESTVQFSLQPLGELCVDRVAHDDAFGRHEKNRIVIIVLGSVDVAGDVGDDPSRRVLGQALGYETNGRDADQW